tara:strand:+ start:1984 stop:2853 length:870 start_codon:yes stop_codon:yes gene_type:complete
MNSSGLIKVVDGSERIRIPIMHEKNGTFQWYSGYETYDVTPQEGFTTAWYLWKQAATTVAINGLELRSNRGSAAIADLLKSKIRQAKMSMADGLASGIFSDGTGSSNKQLTGLAAAIDASPATTAYASIDPATNAAWQNKADADGGATATVLVSKLKSVFNQCSLGSASVTSRPDRLVTTRAIHEAAESLITPRVRFAPNPSGGADLGVEELIFKGAPLVWDEYCTSGTVYLLNSNHMHFFVHAQANMAMTEEGFQKPIDQDALSAAILFMGNLAVNNRRKLGIINGLT